MSGTAPFSVKFWGTRGSIATPGKTTLRYGGNTPCVEARCGSRVIVFDSGTGIRALGVELEEQGVSEIDLLISHFHMDHTQGFPFFTPAYHAGTHINIYTAAWGLSALSEPFHKLMDQPSFPVPFQYLSADIDFHEVNGCFRLGDVAVTTQVLNHPNGCMGYRLEFGGKVVIYLTDHEPYGDERELSVRQFTHGADLLIREAQYTSAEYETKHGWGHSTFDHAVSDAIACGVKKLAIFHHDPQHDDAFLEQQLAELNSRYPTGDCEVMIACEGQSVELS